MNLTVGQLLRGVAFLKPDFQEEGVQLEDELGERARDPAELRSLAQIVARDGTMAASEKVIKLARETGIDEFPVMLES